MSKRKHHAKKLATRRTYPTYSDSNPAWLDQSAETQGIPPIPRERSPFPKRPVAGMEVTQASTLDPNLVAKYINHNKPTLFIRSTGTSRRDDALTQQYPQLPKITAGECHVPCPYCRKPLPTAELRGSKGAEFWEYALHLLPKRYADGWQYADTVITDTTSTTIYSRTCVSLRNAPCNFSPTDQIGLSI